jgi:integrase
VRLEPGTTKNGEGRLIYLTDELQALLSVQWEQHVALFPDCQFVFHRSGKQIRSAYRAWRKACRAAKITGSIPHDFRRTAVRRMVRRGVSERVAMDIAGHKTRSVFDRYNIVAESDLRDAAKKLSGALGSGTATVLATSSADGVGDSVVTH